MKYLILVLLSSLVLGSQMNFVVGSVDLSNVNHEGALSGTAFAKNILVDFDDIEFEMVEDGETFLVETTLYPNRLNFKKDKLNLSAKFPNIEGLNHLQKIKAKDAVIDFSETGFSIMGRDIGIMALDTDIVIDQVDMICGSDAFSFNIEELCSKDLLIESAIDGPFANISVDQHTDQDINVNISAKHLRIKDSSLDIEAASITGSFSDVKVSLNETKLDCFKDPDLNEFDLYKFLEGCYANSNIKGEELKLSAGNGNIEISNGNVFFRKNAFGANARYASFSSLTPPWYAMNLKASCNKAMLSVAGNPLYGCLKRSEITVERIQQNTLVQASRVNDFKDLKIRVSDNVFNLTTKIKMFIRFNVSIIGSIIVDEELMVVKIKVTKAKVAGFKAQNLLFEIIEGFISGDAISIDGDTIIIKL